MCIHFKSHLENLRRECPGSQVSGNSFRLPYLGYINLMKHWKAMERKNKVKSYNTGVKEEKKEVDY